MISVTKIFSFEAAHFLPNHEGKCKNVHGHNYKLEVTFSGDRELTGSNKGMIVDFSDLKEIVDNVIIDQVDHINLNDIFANPTAENMVFAFSTWIQDGELTSLKLIKLKLWETDDSFAEWSKNDNQ